MAGGLYELIRRNRSVRRFDEAQEAGMDTLRGLVELARLSASAANLQPLKYFLSADRKTNALIFPCLSWAGYLTDWPGPAEGERPAAYIVVLGDTGISKTFGCDHAIAAQSIMLGASERGLGGCMIASIKRDSLRAALNIPERFEILLVLALGRPVEEVVITEVPPDGNIGNIRYWRDERGVHYVPKRRIEDIVFERF